MERVAQILDEALGLHGDPRRHFLDRACGGDPALRSEVESLITAHEQAGSRFLNQTPLHFSEFTGTAGASPAPGDRIGAYRLTAVIGHGGMGDVFSAVRDDGQYQKQVALKLVRSAMATPALQERFRTERQILAGFDHPNIARLLDGGTTEQGLPYFVMELVDGQPIDDYCERRRLATAARLELFRQVCAAVQYAHQRLVIHRDIKPGNILVTADGTPKLLDFGIAKILDPSGAAAETVLAPMTPQFASPEQLLGRTITTASDVYSLGVVLYLLLAGRTPFADAARSTAGLARAVEDSPVGLPSSVTGRRELRGDLDAIALKALRAEPELRYGSVEQLSGDIGRHLNGLPVLARRGTWNYRAGRFISRHSAGAAASALVLATLVAGVVVSLREARIAEASQRRAEARFQDVRKLANSLLFEINDSLDNVPGATKGRQLILQRSLEYLDRLAAESGNDPALLRELATAYSRIGDLQGNPMSSNVGDARAAMDSARKGLALREQLARLNPGDAQARLELAGAEMDMAELQMGSAGDMPAAFESGRKARDLLDRDTATAPTDAWLGQSVRAHEMLGVMQVGIGAMGRVGSTSDGVADLRRALELNAGRLKRSPTDHEALKSDALLNMLLADGLSKLGDQPRSLELYRRSLDLFTAVDPQGKDLSVAGNSILVIDRIGDQLLVEGHYAEALGYFEQGEKAARRLAAKDPNEEGFREVLVENIAESGIGLVETGRLRDGIAHLREAEALIDGAPSKTPQMLTIRGYSEVWRGVAEEHAGHLAGAEQAYASARQIHASVLQAGSKDARMRIYLVMAADRLAAARAALGRPEQAARDYDEALAQVDLLLKDDPDDQEVLYAAAETYSGIGTLQMGLAVRDAVRLGRPERLERLARAAQWLARSREASARLLNPTRISFSGFEVTPRDEVAHRLERANAAIVALGGARVEP